MSCENVRKTFKKIEENFSLNRNSSPIISESIITGEAIAGFTLAEVLITLLIIGVVSSLVIPTLINDIQDANYKVAYKKAYAVASQALMQAYNENMLASRITYQDVSAAIDNFNTFKSKFSVLKDCTNIYGHACWAVGESFWAIDTPHYSFIDNSGIAWSMLCDSSCGFNTQVILLDTNGNKGPNKFGKDRFFFYLSSVNNDSISQTSLAGTPKKLIPDSDFNQESNICPTGPCYYTSWLKQ